MIFYTIRCITCMQDYKIIEGSKLYKEYKENPSEQRMCQDCVEQIERDAKKQFFG